MYLAAGKKLPAKSNLQPCGKPCLSLTHCPATFKYVEDNPSTNQQPTQASRDKLLLEPLH